MRRRNLFLGWFGRSALALVAVGFLLMGASSFVGAVAATRDTVNAWLTLPAFESPSYVPGSAGGLPSDIPVWGGRERVNIVLLGVDVRPDDGDDPGRTDFVAVLTIDPATKSAGLISFPRDLWITIPRPNGRSYDERINTAFRQGELDVRGGGPAQMKRTIEYNFGIRPHFYALVDFEGFIKVIDRFGGITVDVVRPLKDNEYPTPDYGIKRIYVAPGLQEMDGATALEYARSRHQDSDLERNRRQQQVLLAARQRALQLDLLPQLPSILLESRDLFRTDMNLSQILALARLAWGIETEDIVLRSLDGSAVSSYDMGASILLPNRAAIGRIIAEVFADPRLRREASNIVIIGEPSRRQSAFRLQAALEAKGISAKLDERIPTERRTETQIVSFGYKPYSTKLLLDALQLPPERVIQDTPGPSHPDIEIIIGDDLQLPN